MNMLRKAWKLESTIAGKLESAAKGFVRSGALEPLEIVHAAVESVQHEIQAGSRGKGVFPFNQVTLTVLAGSREARLRLDAVLNGEPSVRDRMGERLRLKGCVADDLGVDIRYVSRAQPGWSNPDFHLAFARVEREPVAPDPVPEPAPPAGIELKVVCGVGERDEYSLDAARINLGRGREVRDDRNRLLRTNHVVFKEDSGDINRTVSRRHAHLAHDPAVNGYRLFDDGSGHGTGVVRDGRTISVPQGARGVRLRAGDEIILGEARLKFEPRGAV